MGGVSLERNIGIRIHRVAVVFREFKEMDRSWMNGKMDGWMDGSSWFNEDVLDLVLPFMPYL